MKPKLNGFFPEALVKISDIIHNGRNTYFGQRDCRAKETCRRRITQAESYKIQRTQKERIKVIKNNQISDPSPNYLSQLPLDQFFFILITSCCKRVIFLMFLDGNEQFIGDQLRIKANQSIIQQLMQGGGMKPLCKFGENCNRYQQGTCNLYHLPEQIVYSLCRNFQLGLPCQQAENCKKKHRFIVNDEHAIRRFNFIRSIPHHFTSKLSKFKSAGKNYFVLRNGSLINFFQLNIQTKALNDVFNWQLPELPGNLKYSYYDHKGEYIYYSFPNPHTLHEDMGIFHIPTQKTINVTNSHSGRITGMAHFDETILLTTSIAGQLKSWIKVGDTYVTHANSTERLRCSFNPTNLKLELLFLDISEFNGIRIIAVGTNDGRLLFFLGHELTFHQVQFKEDNYSKVNGVKYVTRPGNPPFPCAVALLWSKHSMVSTLLQINLSDMKQEVLIQRHGKESEGNKNIICLFQFVDEYLMVSNLWGEISIYRFPDTSSKVGLIFHQNTVLDVVYCQEELKNTGAKIKYMLILEKKSEWLEGSLGFYILK